MKTIFKQITIPVSGLLLCGCFATERDMSGLKSEVQKLNATLSSVQANQASLSAAMEELSGDIRVSGENIKEFDSQMSRLSSRIDDITAALAAKAEADAAAAAKKVLLPSELFDEANKNLAKGNYDAAIEGFALYLEKYPKGEYRGRSVYLTGDAYYAKQMWREAAVQYATMLKDYPKSKSIPAYRFKYALSILPLDKKTEARQYLQSIIQDYPNSSEAKRAAEELKKIK
jgi:tol-pal system protein YbgF